MKYPAFALPLLLCLFLCGCALFQRPAAVPPVAIAPVIHIAPAPAIPEYNFAPGADGTACLTFEDYLKFEEADAKLYARLSYFRTLLLLAGATFDPPAPAQAAVPAP